MTTTIRFTSQGLDRNRLAKLQVARHPTHRPLDSAHAHRASGKCGLPVIASRGGEQPEWVAMRDPVFAKHRQGVTGKRHVPILGSLAAMHMHHHPCGVDVADLQVESLEYPLT
jgi:hypothetical protein